MDRALHAGFSAPCGVHTPWLVEMGILLFLLLGIVVAGGQVCDPSSDVVTVPIDYVLIQSCDINSITGHSFSIRNPNRRSYVYFSTDGISCSYPEDDPVRTYPSFSNSTGTSEVLVVETGAPCRIGPSCCLLLRCTDPRNCTDLVVNSTWLDAGNQPSPSWWQPTYTYYTAGSLSFVTLALALLAAARHCAQCKQEQEPAQTAPTVVVPNVSAVPDYGATSYTPAELRKLQKQGIFIAP